MFRGYREDDPTTLGREVNLAASGKQKGTIAYKSAPEALFHRPSSYCATPPALLKHSDYTGPPREAKECTVSGWCAKPVQPHLRCKYKLTVPACQAKFRNFQHRDNPGINRTPHVSPNSAPLGHSRRLFPHFPEQSPSLCCTSISRRPNVSKGSCSLSMTPAVNIFSNTCTDRTRHRPDTFAVDPED